MKTEEQIKLRINALKIELEFPFNNLRPFEASRLNYTIQALEWVLKDIPEHCNVPINQCLDEHNCVSCIHNNEDVEGEVCKKCMTFRCQYSRNPALTSIKLLKKYKEALSPYDEHQITYERNDPNEV